MFRISLFVCLLAIANAALAQPRLIAIANFGEHPALRAAVNGFKAEVVRQGFIEGKDVAFDDQHINFDRTLIPQLLTGAQAKKPAMSVARAPAHQATRCRSQRIRACPPSMRESSRTAASPAVPARPYQWRAVP